MQYLQDIILAFYNFLKSIFIVDFSGYSGSIPQNVINMYGYIDIFFKYLCVFYFVYIAINFLIFVFSAGGVRAK